MLGGGPFLRFFFTLIHRQTGCLKLQSDGACSSLDPHSRYLEVGSPQLCEVRRKKLNDMSGNKKFTT